MVIAADLAQRSRHVIAAARWLAARNAADQSIPKDERDGRVATFEMVQSLAETILREVESNMVRPQEQRKQISLYRAISDLGWVGFLDDRDPAANDLIREAQTLLDRYRRLRETLDP